MIWKDYIPVSVSEKYEVFDYRHAAAILVNEFPNEFREICDALGQFHLSRADILKPGGNESDIPKKLSSILRPLGWDEKKMEAKMVAPTEGGVGFYFRNTTELILFGVRGKKARTLQP